MSDEYKRLRAEIHAANPANVAADLVKHHNMTGQEATAAANVLLALQQLLPT